MADAASLAALGLLLDPWQRAVVRQMVADEEAWCRLRAITPPAEFEALAERIKAEYRDIVAVAMTRPYPCPPLDLIVEAHVRRIARGDAP